MRTHLIRNPLILLFFFLPACHGPNVTFDTQKALGAYSGSYGKKGLLTIVINYINKDIVSGYDAYKGKRRNLNGSVTPDGKYLAFVLKEPGDQSSDGTLSFNLDTVQMRLEGKWTPSHKGKEQSFTLKQVVGNSRYGETWCTAWGTDTTLTFEPNGLCTFAFYKNGQDSTSQQLSVSGNYVSKDDSITIEWQKNTYTPSQHMTLKRIRHQVGDEPEDSVTSLEGGGWHLEEINND